MTANPDPPAVARLRCDLDDRSRESLVDPVETILAADEVVVWKRDVADLLARYDAQRAALADVLPVLRQAMQREQGIIRVDLEEALDGAIDTARAALQEGSSG